MTQNLKLKQDINSIDLNLEPHDKIYIGSLLYHVYIV